MFDRFFKLDYQDSNLDKQNQNLLCYHYTIVQSSYRFLLESGAKISIYLETTKFISNYFQKYALFYFTMIK